MAAVAASPPPLDASPPPEIDAGRVALPAFVPGSAAAPGVVNPVFDALLWRSPEVVETAIDAVIAAPSSAPARFALACALSQRGAHAESAQVLRVLREAGCPSCIDALHNVAAPADRDECGFADADRAVAAGLPPAPLRSATEAVLGSINSGDVAAARPYLDARRSITMSASCSVCDFDSVSESRMSRARMITFIRGAERRFEEGPTMYHAPRFLFCDDRCCGGPTGPLSHTSVFVTSVCFYAGARPTLERIDAIDGG